MKKKLVVFSGAGILAESGISTFRDADGLWENHAVEDVASPEGFARNPQLVLDFYNQRRRQLKSVHPNKAHLIIAELQSDFDVTVITQNVDDLHERAGSNKVIHLHGELNKVRPVNADQPVILWEEGLNIGDTNGEGVQLRPHIVWFGEMVPEFDRAVEIASAADTFLIIGTSMNVYPAAGLIAYLPPHCKVFVIDPNLENRFADAENFFKMSATAGIVHFREKVLSDLV